MRTNGGTLGDLLFGQTRGGVFRVLYGHPERQFYVRELSRLIGASPGAVQRELESLLSVGLIERTVSGSQVYYRTNRNHPVFAEMKALVAKTIGAFALLRSALEPLASRIAAAFIYGSMARQEEKAESDVDLMIVGEVALEEVLTQMAPAEQTIGRAINPTIYSQDEFEAKLASGNHFLKSVLRGEKVFLIGAEDELGKVD